MSAGTANDGFRVRLLALTRKEFRQLLRDRSNVAIGIALPLVLILLFGYGISLDIGNVPIAIVLEDSSPVVTDMLAGLQLSPFFDAHLVRDMPAAEDLMATHRVDAILRVPGNFSSERCSDLRSFK